jgi:hypothetical protein
MQLTLKQKAKTVFKLLSEPRIFYSLVSFRSFGYLLEMGWFNAFKSGDSIDADLKPIPWFTYPAVEFLAERLNNKLKVFEFGSGNSSLFFSKLVNHVTAVEHNKSWYAKISSLLPANSKIVFANSEIPREYTEVIKITNQKFDIIIIDGLFRNECIKASIMQLSDTGVIILDDSERDDYRDGIALLVQNGFRQLKFSGIAPGIFFRKCTTIFYKDKNCLII